MVALDWVLFGSAILLVMCNIIATVYVWSAPAYSSSQKGLQTFIIWLIPLLGAATLSYFLWLDRRDRPRRSGVGNQTSITNAQAIQHYHGAHHRGGR